MQQLLQECSVRHVANVLFLSYFDIVMVFLSLKCYIACQLGR